MDSSVERLLRFDRFTREREHLALWQVGAELLRRRCLPATTLAIDRQEANTPAYGHPSGRLLHKVQQRLNRPETASEGGFKVFISGRQGNLRGHGAERSVGCGSARWPAR